MNDCAACESLRPSPPKGALDLYAKGVELCSVFGFPVDGLRVAFVDTSEQYPVFVWGFNGQKWLCTNDFSQRVPAEYRATNADQLFNGLPDAVYLVTDDFREHFLVHRVTRLYPRGETHLPLDELVARKKSRLLATQQRRERAA